MTSPFEEMHLNVCVSLLPSDIGDIYAGIRRHMYRYLMKYHDAVGGVLMAVSHLSFSDGAREGRIFDEMPHIHFNVKAKAQVFRPRAGQILEGRVNKVTSTHVGMLMCGIFNASVAAKEMGEGFTYNAAEMAWQGPRGEVVSLGDDTQFVVKRMHQAAGLISIEGSFEGLLRTLNQGQSPGRSSSVIQNESASACTSGSKPPKKKKIKGRSRKEATLQMEL